MMTNACWGIFTAKPPGGEIPSTDGKLFFHNSTLLPVYKNLQGGSSLITDKQATAQFIPPKFQDNEEKSKQ